VRGRNLIDRAFRLIGLSFVVLQLLFCLVPELALSSLQLTRFFAKLMCTEAYFVIGWHSAHSSRVPPFPFDSRSEIWRINAGPLIPMAQTRAVASRVRPSAP
jgi:hypothetical protein